MKELRRRGRGRGESKSVDLLAMPNAPPTVRRKLRNPVVTARSSFGVNESKAIIAIQQNTHQSISAVLISKAVLKGGYHTWLERPSDSEPLYPLKYT
jgi:hypothetical protein